MEWTKKVVIEHVVNSKVVNKTQTQLESEFENILGTLPVEMTEVQRESGAARAFFTVYLPQMKYPSTVYEGIFLTDDGIKNWGEIMRKSYEKRIREDKLKAIEDGVSDADGNPVEPPTKNGKKNPRAGKKLEDSKSRRLSGFAKGPDGKNFNFSLTLQGDVCDVKIPMKQLVKFSARPGEATPDFTYLNAGSELTFENLGKSVDVPSLIKKVYGKRFIPFIKIRESHSDATKNQTFASEVMVSYSDLKQNKDLSHTIYAGDPNLETDESIMMFVNGNIPIDFGPGSVVIVQYQIQTLSGEKPRLVLKVSELDAVLKIPVPKNIKALTEKNILNEPSGAKEATFFD